MTTGFVERLAAARIGTTFNQYADSAPSPRASGAIPVGAAARASPARRRGARLPRRARLGDPVHVRATAVRHRPGRGDGDDRAAHARQSSGSRTTSCSGTSCRRILALPGRTGSRREPRWSSRSRSSASWRRADGSSRSAGSHTLGSAAHTSATPRTGAPPRFGPGSPTRCWIGSAGGELPGPPQHDSARGDADVALRHGPARGCGRTVTLVLVTGIEGILGLGPAIFLTAGAIAALPAGRLMDRYGRIPVLAAGCVAGIAGCLTTALGCEVESASVVDRRLRARRHRAGDDPALPRGSGGHVSRPRAAPAGSRTSSSARSSAPRSARSSSGRSSPGKSSTWSRSCCPGSPRRGSWSSASSLVLCVRPDPRTIAQQLHFDAGGTERAWRRRSARSSAARACSPPSSPRSRASRGMVSVMNLTGYLVIDHGHHQSDVFTVISLHIVGMYALVLVIGQLVDTVGRRPGQVVGLLLMGVLDARARLVREHLLGVGVALPARPRLEHLLRCGRDGAGRPGAAVRAGQADRADRPALELHRRRRSCCSAASSTASSASRRWRSPRRPSSSCPRPGFCYDPPPAHPMCALFL